MDLNEQIQDFGRRARGAARLLSQISSAQKNAALLAMADEILARTATILAANEKDLATARSRNLSSAMIDRLTLNPPRVEAMAQGIREVACPGPRHLCDPALDVSDVVVRLGGAAAQDEVNARKHRVG